MTDVRESISTAHSDKSNPTDRGDFIWYELMTPDPDGAKAFYDAVVGWDISPEGPPEHHGYRTIGRADGKFAGGVLPLSDEMQSHGARATWLGYVQVPDVDQSIAAIERAGGKTYMAPSDIPAVGRIAMVADPQGAPFYVMKPTPPANDPQARSDVFSPTEGQRVGWNELVTSDPVSARRFYGEQFDWTSDEFMPMGELGEYRFFDHGGQRIGAVCGVMQGQQPKWRYYVRVPSISAAKAKAEQLGGTIHMGPHEVPTGDFIIIGSDPQGAEFALVGGK